MSALLPWFRVCARRKAEACWKCGEIVFGWVSARQPRVLPLEVRDHACNEAWQVSVSCLTRRAR